MKITIAKIGKCKVIDCGPLTLGPATAALREAIREAVRDGTSKVVLNLAKVNYIDSSGLGEIISGHFHVRNQGGNLVLLNVSKKIQKMLVRLRIVGIFDIYDNEQKALEGCESLKMQPEKEEQ